MVCFSSEWKKKEREEKRAQFCDIKIPLAWCDFYHLKSCLRRLTSKLKMVSIHIRNVRQKVARL